MTSPDADATRSAARTGEKYDSIPYTSIAFPRLQPSRLAANARLLGLEAADVKSARTLEIGCASGGHILPLAAVFPDAAFVGVDVSAAQIADGEARGQSLGLKNVSLRARSVTDIDASWGEFDYIICHGVYSWVPDFVRDAILRVCGERLSAHGVAAISFNVLPGWRMFQIVRDSMILHAGAESDHAARSARTRELFDLLRDHSPEKSSYGSVWRNEARRMAEQPDSYLAHEIFEDDNSPCTFRAFAQAAAGHGLGYLGETRLRENVPESGQTERAEVIRRLAGADFLATEQYIDIVTGRTFRESLLVRAGRAAAADRSLEVERLNGLHLVAALDLRITSPAAGEIALAQGEDVLATTADETLGFVLRRLVERQPLSSSLDELLPVTATPRQRGQTAAALLQLLLEGALDAATEPVICARQAGAAPKLWPLIAADCARGAERSATLRHATLAITPALRFLAPLLDGAHTSGDIAETLLRLAVDGKIDIKDDGGAITDPARLRAACLGHVERQIESLLRVGAMV